MKHFYVYEHWRPDKDTCFWVGKGCGRRAYSFKRSSRYNRVIAKLSRLGMCAEVRLVAESLSEEDSLRIECERIKFWRESGSVDLCNMTDGGEGVSGHRHSDETKKKMTITRTGRRHSMESRAKLSATKTGKPQGPHTAEHNAKIGASAKGRLDPEATRLAKKAAARRRAAPSESVKIKISATVKSLWENAEYRSRLIASHAVRPPVTEAAKAKMRASQQARRAREMAGE